MTAPISVIIPTLNAADSLAATADALLAGATEGLVKELIISDGGSDDGTDLIARELGALWCTGAKGRGGQLGRGIERASAPWLLLLHADTHLSEGWTSAVRAHMADHPDKAGWFRLAFRSDGVAPRLVARGANLRSKVFDLPYGDQGLILPRTLLDASGGMPDLPLMEDVALARQLKGRLRELDATAFTSADRYLRDGWTQRVLRNLVTLARYRLGARPEDLAASYTRSPRS